MYTYNFSALNIVIILGLQHATFSRPRYELV